MRSPPEQQGLLTADPSVQSHLQILIHAKLASSLQVNEGKSGVKGKHSVTPVSEEPNSQVRAGDSVAPAGCM